MTQAMTLRPAARADVPALLAMIRELAAYEHLTHLCIASEDELAQELSRKGEPVFEAVATNGTGVFDTLKAVAKQVLTELRKG